MAIYRGLNVAKTMADVDDPIAALSNLGLKKADFDLIAGLTGSDVGVDVSDIHNLSGLTSDAKKELSSLENCVQTTAILSDRIPDVSTPLYHNIRIDGNSLSGGAIKYKFLDFNSVIGGKYEVKEADISTSRLSSWSPMGDAPNEDSYIVYGSDAKVIGDTFAFTDLAVTDEPKQREFRAEVPTHAVQLNINGATENFMAMKGIPLSFICNFKDANIKAAVTPIQDSAGTIPITFKITNLDTGGQTYNSGDGTDANPGSIGTGSIGSPAFYEFSGVDFRRRRVDIYYDPSKMLRLDLPQLEISSLPSVTLPSLTNLTLSSNNFSLMPQFRNDGTVDRQGFTGGTGIAPNLEILTMTNNNLGRGFDALLGDTSVASHAGGSSSQLNRLPLSIRELRALGCFTDGSQTIDLTDYLNLRYVDLDSRYADDLYRRMDSGYRFKPSPKTYNVNSMLSFASNGTGSDSGGDFVSLILREGLKFPSSGQAVKYNFRVDADGNLGTVGSSGLVDGNIYYLDYISGDTPTGTTGDTASYYVCSNSNLSAGSRMNVHNSGITGVYHSMIPWDSTQQNWDGTVGAPLVDTGGGYGGIQTYRFNHQDCRRLSPGVYNSRNLYTLTTQSTRIETNSEYPYFDENNKARSSADMAIPTPQSEFVYNYFSDYGHHNIIDFTNHPRLRYYRQCHVTLYSKYEDPERSIIKFKGCSSLALLYLYNLRGVTGDWETESLFQNLPKLYYVNLMAWGGQRSTGRFRDDTFTGTDALQYFYVGSITDRYDHDFFGCEGNASNTQGLWMSNFTNFRRIYAVHNYGGGALMAEDASISPNSKNLDLSNKPNLNMWHMYGNNFRGTCPNFLEAFPRMWYYNIGYQAVWLAPHDATKKQVYKIGDRQLTNDANYVGDAYYTQADYEAIGWPGTQSYEDNRDAVGIAYAKAIGSTPANRDAFRLTNIVISPTAPLRYVGSTGKRYVIHKVGNTNWSAIDSSYASGYVYKKGTVIRYNNTTITNSIAGSDPGECMPYATRPRFRSLGFTGLFPGNTSNHSVVGNMYLHWNGFVGQFPKLKCSRMWRIFGYRNHFTGNIPDFSECTNLYYIKFHRNQLSGYEEGSFANLRNVRQITLDNNLLQANVLGPMVSDLIEAYNLNTSRTCRVDLRVQGGANPLREDSKFDGTTGPESTENKLKTLRAAGWIIQLSE